MAKLNLRLARKRRHTRLRVKVVGTASRPRLCVFRSLKHIYVQVIDDSSGRTLVSASSLDPEFRDKNSGITKVKGAELVGSLIGRRVLYNGVSQVVFDRGGYKYHGRVKALAEAARQAGLQF